MKITDLLLYGGIGFVAYELYKGRQFNQMWGDVPILPGLVSTLTTNVSQLVNSGSQTGIASSPTVAHPISETMVVGEQNSVLPMGMAGLGLYGALIPNNVYTDATYYELSDKYYR